jgi:hypothetical protein
MSIQSHLPVSSKTSKQSFSRPQWFVIADGQAADRRSDNDSDPTRRLRIRSTFAMDREQPSPTPDSHP